MKNRSTQIVTILAMSLTLAFVGCSDPETEAAAGGGTISDPPPATVDTHAHPTEGPHHGDLIELGNEEYHAELIHPEDHDDDAHASENSEAGHEHAGITIYILDSSAKEMVAIEASEIAINLSHDGNPNSSNCKPCRLTAIQKASRLGSRPPTRISWNTSMKTKLKPNWF